MQWKKQRITSAFMNWHCWNNNNTLIHRPIKHKDMPPLSQLLLLSVLLLISVFESLLLPCFTTTSTLPAPPHPRAVLITQTIMSCPLVFVLAICVCYHKICVCYHKSFVFPPPTWLFVYTLEGNKGVVGIVKGRPEVQDRFLKWKESPWLKHSHSRDDYSNMGLN